MLSKSLVLVSAFVALVHVNDAVATPTPVFQVTTNSTSHHGNESTATNATTTDGKLFHKTFTIVSTAVMREISVDLPGRVFVSPSNHADPAPVLKPVAKPKPVPRHLSDNNATSATSPPNTATNATSTTIAPTVAASSNSSASSSSDGSGNGTITFASLNGTETNINATSTSNSTSTGSSSAPGSSSADREVEHQEDQEHEEKDLLEKPYDKPRIVATVVVSCNDSSLLDLIHVVGIPATPLPTRSFSSRDKTTKEMQEEQQRAEASEQKGFVVHLKPNAKLHASAVLLTEIFVHQLGRLNMVTANSANDFVVDDQDGMLVHNCGHSDVVLTANAVQNFFVASHAPLAARSMRFELTDLKLVQMQLPALTLTEKFAMSATRVELASVLVEELATTIVYSAMTGNGETNVNFAKSLMTSELETQVLGDGYFVYQGEGTCEHERLFLQGGAEYQAPAVWSNHSYVSIAGFGNATVRAHWELDCSILPYGKVFYVDEKPLFVNATGHQLTGSASGFVQPLNSEEARPLKQFPTKKLPAREPAAVTVKLAGFVPPPPRPEQVKIETSSNSGDEDEDAKITFRNQVLTIVFAALGFVAVVVAFGMVREFVRQHTLRRSYQQLP